MARHRYCLLLGGEQPDLARAEALTLFETFGLAPRAITQDRRLLLVELAQPLSAAQIGRLALTRSVAEQLRSVDEVAELAAAAADLALDARTFAVRCHLRHAGLDGEQIARRLGEALRHQARVDLTRPEVTVQVMAGRRLHLGVVRHATAYRSCQARHLNRRPRFSPISLPPRLARAMVNLADLAASPPDATLLDPFCGTGGILLEAAEMGLRAAGRDLLPEMVEASRENLAHFGLAAALAPGDVGAVAELPNIGAIVTDPPYGRSTTTRREPLTALLARAAAAFREALPVHRRVVLALPDPELFPPDGFRELHRCAWYVHKSLTRHVLVLERE